MKQEHGISLLLIMQYLCCLKAKLADKDWIVFIEFVQYKDYFVLQVPHIGITAIFAQ